MTVIDASITVRVLLAWPHDELLRQRFAHANRSLHAPSHLDIEVQSAIVGMLRGEKVDEARAGRMVDQFNALRINRHATGPLGRRILELRHNFTAYDGAYVALAESIQQPLLTCDLKFTKAPAKAHSAEIHTFPA